ncbi:MAG: hypothetical protein ACRDKU_00350 [Gaiellaceae bacterium]
MGIDRVDRKPQEEADKEVFWAVVRALRAYIGRYVANGIDLALTYVALGVLLLVGGTLILGAAVAALYGLTVAAEALWKDGHRVLAALIPIGAFVLVMIAGAWLELRKARQ